MAIDHVYIISDLHLGGGTVQDRRRGRLMDHPESLTRFINAIAEHPKCSELVINGDFVDFLAEEHDAPPRYRPFLADGAVAAACLLRIMNDGPDAPVFDALAALTRSGHTLTILLGNHDVELSLPKVTAALLQRIGPCTLIPDNLALRRGDAIIEHGNRYDRYNQVDHDGLRRLRSLQSRGLSEAMPSALVVQPGSNLVARVINPIKQTFPIIDRLKPERAGMLPLLLALDPSAKRSLLAAVTQLAPALRRGIDPQGQPVWSHHVSRQVGPAPTDDADPVEAALRATLSPEDRVIFARGVGSIGHEVSTRAEEPDTRGLALSWASLLSSTNETPLQRRLDSLHVALRALQHDRSFARDTETDGSTLDGALGLARAGAKVVVFGHTHLAKDVALDGAAIPPERRVAARYMNCGTWAGLVRLPNEVVGAITPQSREILRTFVNDMLAGQVAKWSYTLPTYVVLDLQDDVLLRAELRVWDDHAI